MKKSTHWQDKRIVITGGTSGLGKALALALDKAGAQVVIVARRKAGIKQMIEGSNIHFIQGDVSAKRQIHRIVGEALAILGGIDILFNNAGYVGETPLKLLIDTECEDIERILATNLIGPFRLTKAFLPGMILQKSGIVINISSDAAINAYPHWGGYSISKAALDHLSRIWNEELSKHGIRFLAIDPGDMNTPMYFDAIPDANPADLNQPADVAVQLLQFIQDEAAHTGVRWAGQDWRMTTQKGELWKTFK